LFDRLVNQVEIALVALRPKAGDLHQHELEILEEPAQLGIFRRGRVEKQPGRYQQIRCLARKAYITAVWRAGGGERDQ